ncbi:MSP domain-containing protein [Heracleum sosnowskyi]|uniref:MSP domain-containing protein n=1 Tax=Heracleum sosnowskyi TaxID=360622 RepID=A0AAD8IHF4_9APIA|nr:MSP domain-containing protein [Heracleum sosnowskyi]
MDRLVKPDVKELSIEFKRNEKCFATFRLTNLMHTMTVAVSLTTTNPSLLSFTNPLSTIPPLSTSSFTLLLSKPSSQPPLSSPLDTILVKSTVLPVGKANQDELRRMFLKSGPRILKDAIIPISFLGPHVVEFLLTPAPRKLDISFLLAKAISGCDESQLSLLLRSAAKCGNSYFASVVIDAGANVNHRDSNKLSVMALAVQSGNADLIEILIDSGYLIDNSVDWLLHEAAGMDRVDLLEVLCFSCLEIDLNSADKNGRTALHVAAIYGHLEVLRFLLSVGSDPDVADCKGWTPLHCASAEGHMKAVELLLDCSRYVKYAVTKDGQTAYALAVKKGNSELYDMLHLGDVWHRAATKGDVDALKSCLAEGVEVNGKDQNGWTPLHRAAFKGRIESVKLLLSYGAKVNVVDDYGYTPLHRAVEAGHVKVAMALVGHGAKENMKGLNCVVPMHSESFKKHLSLVSPLCEKKERA